MNVDAAVLRDIENSLGKYLSVSHNYYNIGSKLLQLMHAFLRLVAFFQAHGLIYGDIML